jgi:lysozyme
MGKSPIRLADLFKYYKALPHQLAALDELETEILTADPGAFDRSRAWFSTWSQAGKQPESSIGPAVALIRKWEGCRLETYLCSAGVPTIGYGSTGPKVKMGMRITQEEADALLEKDVQRFVDVVDLQITAKLTNNQRCALICFAFNVGAGALFDSTLRRRLNSGEDPNRVAKEELPRWNKAGGKVLEGLARRREDELKLFLTP